MSTVQSWGPVLVLDLDAGPVDWTQITGGQIRYGKAGDALSYSAGLMTLVLQNYDGRYTPGDSGALHGGEQWIGKTCVLCAVDSLGIDPVFFGGVIVDVEFTMTAQYDSTITLTVTDVIGELSSAQLTDVTITEAPARSQIDQILSSSGVSQTSITTSYDNGRSLQGRTITQTAGSALALIEQSDGGDIFARQGRALLRGTAGNILFRPHGSPPLTGGLVSDAGGTRDASFDGSTNEWRIAGLVHDLKDGDPVRFRPPTGGGPTGQFHQDTTYWVVDSIADTFKLSATEGGAAITSNSDSTPRWRLGHYHFLVVGDETSGQQFKFRSIDLVTGGQVNFTTATFTRIGGQAQEANAPTTYGTRSISRTGLLNLTDTDTMDLADDFLAQYGPSTTGPNLQLKRIIGQPIKWDTPNVYSELVWYSTGDLINVHWTGPGPTATENTAVGIISNVTWTLTPTMFYPTWELEAGRIVTP